LASFWRACASLWKALKFVFEVKILKAVITFAIKIIFYIIFIPIILKVVKWIFILLFFAFIFVACIVAFFILVVKKNR
jgi:hypothetical protein